MPIMKGWVWIVDRRGKSNSIVTMGRGEPETSQPCQGGRWDSKGETRSYFEGSDVVSEFRPTSSDQLLAPLTSRLQDLDPLSPIVMHKLKIGRNRAHRQPVAANVRSY